MITPAIAGVGTRGFPTAATCLLSSSPYSDASFRNCQGSRGVVEVPWEAMGAGESPSEAAAINLGGVVFVVISLTFPVCRS
jgi:hypothetical protein